MPKVESKRENRWTDSTNIVGYLEFTAKSFCFILVVYSTSLVRKTHLSSTFELNEGTHRLIGASSTGKHMSVVETLQKANEIGTFCLERTERWVDYT